MQKRHAAATCEFLVPAPARLELVAIGGLSGTGKSSLSASLADSIGRPPGAVHLRSDIERKRFYGAKEFDRLPSEAYRPEDSQRIYERLRALASLALFFGQSTILDAVHLRPKERYAAKMVAAQNNAHFPGLWLEAPLGMVKERIAKRAMDASDATVEVVTAQAKDEPGAMDWQPLDSSASLETTVAGALAAILR